MNALDRVYAQNEKRLAESRAAQNAGQPAWQANYTQPVNPTSTTRSQGVYVPTTESRLSPMAESRPTDGRKSGFVSGPAAANLAQPGQGSPIQNSKAAAMGFWNEQKQAWDKANEDTLVDRGAMLQELADFKAQTVLSNERIAQTMSDTEEKLHANTTEILDRVRNQFSSMGRSASPYMMAELSKRLALQNQDKLNTTRSQLELDRAEIHKAYLDRLYEVLGNTRRTVMDPQTVLAMMQQLGASNAGSVSMGGGLPGGGRRQTTGSGNNISRSRISQGFQGGMTMSADPLSEAKRLADRSIGGVYTAQYQSGADNPRSGSMITNNAYKIRKNAEQQAGQGYDNYDNVA